jgi:ubiquinone/menaquinone biosynthesis C-methylase UbiE
VSLDPYNRTDQLDKAAVTTMAARLEERGQDPTFLQMIDDYLARMDVKSLSMVLDVGCGTGVVARRLAHCPAFNGMIVGIDRSPDLIELARKQAVTDEVSRSIEFRVGDAASLNTFNGKFDAAIAHTLISHVDDPLAVIINIRDCVRPGGLIAIFDGDYASWICAGANPEAGRQLADAVIAKMTNPNVIREFPWLARKAGLQLVATNGYVLSEIGASSFFASAIATFPKLLPLSGIVDGPTAQRLVDIQRQNMADQTFFGAVNFYWYLLRRPK